MNFFIEVLCSLSRMFHSNVGIFGRKNHSNLVSYNFCYVEVLHFSRDDHLPDLFYLKLVFLDV